MARALALHKCRSGISLSYIPVICLKLAP
jgi:hypothetical protein